MTWIHRLPKLYSPDITRLEMLFESQILSGPNWRLIAEHHIVVKSGDYSIIRLSKTVPAKTITKRNRAGTKDVFSIEQYGTDPIRVLVLINGQDAGCMIQNQSKAYTEIVSVAVETMTTDQLDRNIIANSGSVTEHLITNQYVVIVCPAVPYEVKEWLLFNLNANLAKNLQSTRRELSRKISSGIAAMLGADI